jgi:hypothetical protein
VRGVRRASIVVIVSAASLTLPACGGSDEATPTTTKTATEAEAPTDADTTTTAAESLPCKKPPRIAIESISFGLTRGGTLTAARYVEVPASLRNSQGWPAWLIAARIKQAVGIWATSRNGDGPISAVDEVGRMYTDWGAAAAPDSPFRDIMDALAFSDAASAVVACVGG